MPRAQPPAVHRFAHEAMATTFEIFVAEKEEAYARQAARAAFDEIDRLERLFSRFDPSSETSRIGRLPPGGTLRIGLETAEILGLSAFIQSETGGAFDVNYLGIGRTSGRRTRSRPRPLTALLRIDTDGRGFEVTRLRPKGRAAAPPIDLDLGAVGKGYALDAALTVLRDWEVGNVLLHAGTSTALAEGPGPPGPGQGRGWPVGAGAGPDGTAGPGRVLLLKRALSGSGTEVKGDAHRRPPDRPARRRAYRGLGLPPVRGRLGRLVDGVHGHVDR